VSLRSLERHADFRAALTAFRDKFPDDPRGYSMQGRLYAAEGDFDRSLVAFEAAEKLSPNNAVFVNNVATSLARLERNAAAGERFARVVELDAEFPNAAYFAAASFSMAGRTQDAAHWMRYCLQHDLATLQQFEQEDFFANLRASNDWPP
jgi:cytochrome c-type biogenesis protein CcmH/NrfG